MFPLLSLTIDLAFTIVKLLFALLYTVQLEPSNLNKFSFSLKEPLECWVNHTLLFISTVTLKKEIEL